MRTTAGLGVTGPVVADLYKLLVYDPGSFFVNHRDTEKAAGMFATLIIVLPSIYTGGALLVRHRDREARLDLSCPEPSQVAFAAFYADCVHEVLPITSGYRLALVYNLRRQGRGQLPEPPNYDTEQTRVAALLRQWSAAKDAPDDDSPEKLLYPLEHAYTPAELAFEALKGTDAAVADVLVTAASAADCDLHLALLSITESGSAEHIGYYGSRRRRWSDEEDEEDFEVSEVHDRHETLSDWRRPDGSQPALGDLPFLEPPRDWARASAIACSCAHCRELSRFLADPDHQRWTFKAPETGRRHLEGSIQRSGCDLDLVTDRRGPVPTAWCVRRIRRVTTDGRNSVSATWPIWHSSRRRRAECCCPWEDRQALTPLPCIATHAHPWGIDHG